MTTARCWTFHQQTAPLRGRATSKPRRCVETKTSCWTGHQQTGAPLMASNLTGYSVFFAEPWPGLDICLFYWLCIFVEAGPEARFGQFSGWQKIGMSSWTGQPGRWRQGRLDGLL